MKVRVWAVYEVHDPAALGDYARRRDEDCRGEEPDFADLPETVLEAVINSDENPSNDALGLEILDYGAALEPDAAADEGPRDLMTIRRHRDRGPATLGQARRILAGMGYSGDVVPAAEAGEGKGAKGFFRIVLPHYGLPPHIVPLAGEWWEVLEEDQGCYDEEPG